jgi:N-sulfoglucosamine sulfohydrolase
MKLLSFLFVLALCAVPARAAEPARPDIIFLFGDDVGRYASAYRAARASLCDVIETPHMDRLARGGVLFTDAHCSAPSCTPSRGAVFTGRHFYRNGSASQLHHPWPQGTEDPAAVLPTFLNVLAKHGYHTGCTYKTHVPAPMFGGKERVFNKSGAKFNGYTVQVSRAGDMAAERARLLAEVRGNFSAFLDAAAPGQPVAWQFSPTQSHRTWAAGSAQKLWKLDPEQLKGKLPAFLPDVPEIRQDMADYLGTIMAFDEAVGVIIDELEKRGRLANALVTVSGDHGAPGFPRGKCNLYTFGTQVPLILHWPAGIAGPGRRVENPASLIHLAPTFLAAAGAPLPSDMNGVSLLPVLRDAAASGHTALMPDYCITGRELHVPDAREDGLPYPTRALRDRRFLYIRNFKPDRWPVYPPPLPEKATTDMDFGPARDFFTAHFTDPALALPVRLGFDRRPAEELYDLTKDPDEMTNLADAPEHAATRAAMSERLLKLLRETGDPRVAGEGDGFDRAPYHQPGRKSAPRKK